MSAGIDYRYNATRKAVIAAEEALFYAREEFRAAYGDTGLPVFVDDPLATVSGTDHDTTHDTVRAKGETVWRQFDRNTPRAFWDVATWLPDGNWVSGSLDVADRKRIGLAVLASLRADRIAPDDTPSERGGDDAA